MQWLNEQRTLESGSRFSRCSPSWPLLAMWAEWIDRWEIDGKTFIGITTKTIEPGFPDRLHVGLHPEACLQVWVRGEGGDEGLRHVHPLKVARQKLDFQGPSESKKNHSQKLDCQAKTPLKLHSQKPNMVFGTFTFLQILFSNSTLQSFSKWKIKLPC